MSEYDYLMQSLYPVLEQPSITWRSDYALEVPELLYPTDGGNVCTEKYISDDGVGTGVILKWNAVSGADYYIIQMCNNSSFHGATLRAVRVATNIYELLSMDDLRGGEELFWRVMAYNTNGGVSAKSAVRRFKYECPSNTPKASPKGGSGGGSQSLCDYYNVVLNIKGPDVMFACDSEEYHLQAAWDCVAENGNALATHVSTEWLIEGPPGVPEAWVWNPQDWVTEVSSQCDISQVVTLRANVSFTDVAGNPFVCSVSRKIKVISREIQNKKSYLKIDIPEGLYFEMYDEDYTSTSVNEDNLSVADSEAKPTLSQSDEEDHSVVASGPVVVVESEPVYYDGIPPEYPCYIQLGQADGKQRKIRREARVHIGLGCGLHHVAGLIDTQRTIVDTKTIFSVDPFSVSLTALADCCIQLDMTLESFNFGLNECGEPVYMVEGASAQISEYVCLYDCCYDCEE